MIQADMAKGHNKTIIQPRRRNHMPYLLDMSTNTLPELPNTSSPVTVKRDQLAAIPVPAGTHSWRPVSHTTILSEVDSRLRNAGTTITGEQLTVTHGGSRLFGILRVATPETTGVIQTIGVRNAHDQAFAAGIAAGMQVLVCSNLSFSGDIVFKRRHTVNVMRDLPEMIRRAVGSLQGLWDRQRKQVEAYSNTRLLDRAAHHLTIKALDAGVISGSRIPKVISEWREPQHDEFQPRTVWSFFNAITEHLKDYTHDLPARTQRLHTVCDDFVGL
jgi:hypothetical protein